MSGIHPNIHRFVDAVTVRLSERPSNEASSVMRSMGISTSIQPAAGHQRYSRWPWRWTIYQPSDEALEVADGVAANREAFVNRVELAMDICTRSKVEAMRLADRFDRHLVKLWSRSSVRYYKSTRYSGDRHQRNNLVTYWDRPSKVTGEHCLHVEWRARGREACQRLGIRQPGDLVEFGHAAFWQRRFVLEQPVWSAIVRQFSRVEPEQPERIVGHVKALCGEQVTAAGVRWALRDRPWFRADRAMKRLSMSDVVHATDDYAPKIPPPLQ